MFIASINHSVNKCAAPLATYKHIRYLTDSKSSRRVNKPTGTRLLKKVKHHCSPKKATVLGKAFERAHRFFYVFCWPSSLRAFFDISQSCQVSAAIIAGSCWSHNWQLLLFGLTEMWRRYAMMRCDELDLWVVLLSSEDEWNKKW